MYIIKSEKQDWYSIYYFFLFYIGKMKQNKKPPKQQ